MKKISYPLLIGLSACSALNSMANEIELSLSDHLIDFRLTTQYEQDFSGRFAYMHSDDENVDSDMLSYLFSTTGSIDRFDISLGAKVFWLDVESETGYGIALGGGASTEIVEKLTIGAELYYSPDIITGGDLEDTLEIDLRASYQVIDNGSVFLGYRFLEADVGFDDFDVYDNFYLGMKFVF